LPCFFEPIDFGYAEKPAKAAITRIPAALPFLKHPLDKIFTPFSRS
jgi:hypothetical protein